MTEQDQSEVFSISVNDFRPEKFRARKVLPRADIIDGRLPRGKVVLFAGEGGIGKSMVLLHLFEAISRGSAAFFGGIALGGSQSCILVFAEDDGDTVARRLQAMTTKTLSDEGFILPMPDIGVNQLFSIPYPGASPEPTAFFDWLDQALSNEKAVYGKLGFLALDPFAALFGVDENKSSDVQAVWSHLNRLSVKHDVCIIVTHHLRKDSTQARAAIRGSSALVDGVRAAYVMTKEENPSETLRQLEYPTDAGLEVLSISLVKDNLGLHGGHITLVRNKDGSLTDVTNKMQTWITAEDAILKVILEKNTTGRSITKTGKNGLYSSKEDRWPETLKKLSRNKIETKVETLINQGKILSLDGKLFVTDEFTNES